MERRLEENNLFSLAKWSLKGGIVNAYKSIEQVKQGGREEDSLN